MANIAAFYLVISKHVIIYDVFDRRTLKEKQTEKVFKIHTLDDLNKLFADIKKLKKKDDIFIEWQVVRDNGPYHATVESLKILESVKQFFQTERIPHARPLNSRLKKEELKIFKNGLEKLGIKIKNKSHMQHLYALALHATKTTVKQKLKKLYLAFGHSKQGFNHWYNDLLR